MKTIQLNIQKPIDYKLDFDIKHNNYIQIINGNIVVEGRSIKDVSYLDEESLDYLSNYKYYSLYSHFAILEYFKNLKLINRNMEFYSFKSAVFNEIFKDPENARYAIKKVVNRMISMFNHSIKYFDFSKTDLIVKSLSGGFPITMTANYSIDSESKGFNNCVVVFGIIRDDTGKIVGINAHDYAGDANSKYQNRNGNSVVYIGDLFNRIFKDSVVGIVIPND